MSVRRCRYSGDIHASASLQFRYTVPDIEPIASVLSALFRDMRHLMVSIIYQSIGNWAGSYYYRRAMRFLAVGS
jgi:hypothetical protein